MSFNVLVVPEDPTHNGYILRPLVERILEECGRPHARITVLTNPRAKGYDHAKSLIMSESFDRYGHMDLILFLPDADGEDKLAEFKALEVRSAERQLKLICECAVQEVEVWLMAGHVDKLNRPWQQIRSDTRVKENIFQRFLEQHGDTRLAGGGREQLMQETLRNYGGLLARCPELRSLQDRICTAVAG